MFKVEREVDTHLLSNENVATQVDVIKHYFFGMLVKTSVLKINNTFEEDPKKPNKVGFNKS